MCVLFVMCWCLFLKRNKWVYCVVYCALLPSLLFVVAMCCCGVLNYVVNVCLLLLLYDVVYCSLFVAVVRYCCVLLVSVMCCVLFVVFVCCCVFVCCRCCFFVVVFF